MVADTIDCTGSLTEGREDRRIALLHRRAVAMLMSGRKCLVIAAVRREAERQKIGRILLISNFLTARNC